MKKLLYAMALLFCATFFMPNESKANAPLETAPAVEAIANVEAAAPLEAVGDLEFGVYYVDTAIGTRLFYVIIGTRVYFFEF